MAMSPSSSAQAAREAVGMRLRELRQEAGLQGQEVAAACGWHASKASRLENGRTPPTPEDIRAWCKAVGAETHAADLIAASRSADSMYVEWRRREHTGLRALQDSYRDLFHRTTLFRAYSSTLVPGLLQTEGYATALLGSIAGFRRIPNDVEAAVAARLARSEIIHSPGKRFSLLVEEAALRHQLGDAEAMAAQLGYLLTAGALPNVSLGVVPFDAPNRRAWPLETFHVYDDEMVSVELLSARVTVATPSEVGLYLRAHAGLADLALYGAAARARIAAALGALG
ncbi:helix-turn-helix transcriptional regulator [Streptomyces sp. TRM70308]|uniref:helix-turn-helix domain-containing protein n=1 Tax=Streptomyces sp. TRM70308 TaxID=3131932 RepID=UPI003CFF043B